MEPTRCSNCGNINPAENSFCNKCGAPLPLPSGDSGAIEAEIRRLRGMVNQINARLDTLEGKQPAAQQPIAQAETQAGVPPVKPAEIKPQAAPATPARPIPLEEPAAVEPREKAGAFLKPAPAEPEEKTAILEKAPGPREKREWEQILGGNWLARIGVLALVIGIGFFLKYAFDNNWIGPTTRVILGSAAGFILLWLGFYWRKRYPVLTQVLSGGGIAVFYLSIFASSATYHLINIYIATVLLLAVSVLATLLALRYNSIALSIIGIFGAYFAPFILGAFNGSGRTPDNTAQAVMLLAYIIIIGMGVLVLSAFRNWRWFSLLALICSLITYGFWRGEFDRVLTAATAEISITVIFLIFTGATVFFHFIKQHKPLVYDYLFLIINAAAYAIISNINLRDSYEGWMGGFFLLLAIFYFLLSFLLLRCSITNTVLSRISLALGLVFLTIAIPVQFRDSIWTPILFAVEMTAAARLSTLLKISSLRYFSYLTFIIMIWDLLLIYTGVNTRDFTPVINGRFLVFIIGIAAAYMTFFILQTRRHSIPEWPVAAAFLLIITNIITILLISLEVWDSFGGAISSASEPRENSLIDARNLSLTGAWAICAVVGLIIGIINHWRFVRIGSLVLLAITIVKVFAYDVFQLETGYRIIAFVGLGILLLVSAYLYQRYRKAIRGVFTG